MSTCPDIWSVISMTPAAGWAYFTAVGPDGIKEEWSLPIVGFGVVVECLYDSTISYWRPASGLPPAIYSTTVQPLVMHEERYVTPLDQYLLDFLPSTRCRVVLDK